MNIVKKIFKYILLTLRPLLGSAARCRYTITCTPFAINELETKSFFKAMGSITKRVLSCFSIF